MATTSEPIWSALPDSAQQAIIKVMELLGSGFTGRIEIECGEGGVKRMHQTIPWKPRNIANGKEQQ